MKQKTEVLVLVLFLLVLFAVPTGAAWLEKVNYCSSVVAFEKYEFRQKLRYKRCMQNWKR